MGTNYQTKAGDVELFLDAVTGLPVIQKFEERFLHTVVFGEGENGDQNNLFLSRINQDLQNHEAGITIFDPDGNLAKEAQRLSEYHGRKTIVVTPLTPIHLHSRLYADFDKALAEGHVVIITAEKELTGKEFVFEALEQFISSVFRRKPLHSKERRPNFLYVANLFEIASKDLVRLLTLGRSYRVAVHLSSPMVSEEMFKNVYLARTAETIFLNARNLIVPTKLTINDMPHCIRKVSSDMFNMDFGSDEDESCFNSLELVRYRTVTNGKIFMGIGNVRSLQVGY